MQSTENLLNDLAPKHPSNFIHAFTTYTKIYTSNSVLHNTQTAALEVGQKWWRYDKKLCRAVDKNMLKSQKFLWLRCLVRRLPCWSIAKFHILSTVQVGHQMHIPSVWPIHSFWLKTRLEMKNHEFWAKYVQLTKPYCCNEIPSGSMQWICWSGISGARVRVVGDMRCQAVWGVGRRGGEEGSGEKNKKSAIDII